MSDRFQSLDPRASVNEILRRYPAAISVLNEHGIDTCCGGALALSEASKEAHADLPSLIEQILATGSTALPR